MGDACCWRRLRQTRVKAKLVTVATSDIECGASLPTSLVVW